jgi:hypothetical protein
MELGQFLQSQNTLALVQSIQLKLDVISAISNFLENYTFRWDIEGRNHSENLDLRSFFNVLFGKNIKSNYL